MQAPRSRKVRGTSAAASKSGSSPVPFLLQEQHYLPESSMSAVYAGKCKDQNLEPSRQREKRFIDVMMSSSVGLALRLKQNGLGPHAAMSLCEALLSDDGFAVIDIEGNNIHDEGAAAFGVVLEHNSRIVALDLRSNDIGPAGAERLLEPLISTNRTLTYLDLSSVSGVNRNHIQLGGSKALSLVLSCNNVLTSLNLSSNGIGSEAVREICQGLSKNRSLTFFDISSNSLGPEGCRFLFEALDSCVISTLRLERNEIGDDGIASVASFLQRNKKHHGLRTLDVAYNDFGYGDETQYFLMECATDKCVRSLRLDGNHLVPAIGVLTSLLTENQSMKKLFLSACNLNPESGQALCRALKLNNSIQVLDLSSNWLDFLGSSEMSDVLSYNSSLRTLDLSNDRINDKAGFAIASGLLNNSTLTSINLRNNNIRDAGIRFADIAQTHDHILFMDATFNDVNYRALKTIEDSIAENVKKWRISQKDRLQRRIDALKLHEQELDYTIQSIATEEKDIHQQRIANSKKQRELEAVLEKNEIQLEKLQSAYDEKKKQRLETEHQLELLRQELGDVRADRQIEVDTLVSRLEALSNETLKLERETKKIKSQVEQAEHAADLSLRPYRDRLREIQQQQTLASRDEKWEEEQLTEFRRVFGISDETYAEILRRAQEKSEKNENEDYPEFEEESIASVSSVPPNPKAAPRKDTSKSTRSGDSMLRSSGSSSKISKKTGKAGKAGKAGKSTANRSR